MKVMVTQAKIACLCSVRLLDCAWLDLKHFWCTGVLSISRSLSCIKVIRSSWRSRKQKSVSMYCPCVHVQRLCIFGLYGTIQMLLLLLLLLLLCSQMVCVLLKGKSLLCEMSGQSRCHDWTITSVTLILQHIRGSCSQGSLHCRRWFARSLREFARKCLLVAVLQP